MMYSQLVYSSFLIFFNRFIKASAPGYPDTFSSISPRLRWSQSQDDGKESLFHEIYNVLDDKVRQILCDVLPDCLQMFAM